MCSNLFIPIKAVNSAGQRHAFVPCGKCEDCRYALRNSWVFRLRVELEQLCKKGWKIGFFTLTYSDAHLPYVPFELFKTAPCEVACFDKADIADFFTKLKKWLLREYDCKKVVESGTKRIIKDTRIRYMLCSEFGEFTKRPHYHGIVCVPCNVDMRKLHLKIKELWYHSEHPDVIDLEPNQKGFVFPFDFDGTPTHNGFVCTSVKAASLYAAKYCCKDLAFYESIKNHEFFKSVTVGYDAEGHYIPSFTEEIDHYCLVDNSRDNEFRCCIEDRFNPLSEAVTIKEFKFSRYKPFHYQSKSLGLCFLDGLSDAQKLQYLRNGVCFVGEDVFQGLPVYLKNKIVFTPKYEYEVNPDTGEVKRLVRREAKEFFRKNFPELFELKVKSLVEKLSVMLREETYKGFFSSSELADFRNLSLHHQSLEHNASEYLAYFGVPEHECLDTNLSLQWFRRYEPDFFDFNGVPCIHESKWSRIQYEYWFLFNVYSRVKRAENLDKCRENRKKAYVHDFITSQL